MAKRKQKRAKAPFVLPRVTTWRNLSGDVLEIADMETEHICNCIKMLLRKQQEIQHEVVMGLADSGTLYKAELLNLEAKIQGFLKVLRPRLAGAEDVLLSILNRLDDLATRSNMEDANDERYHN